MMRQFTVAQAKILWWSSKELGLGLTDALDTSEPFRVRWAARFNAVTTDLNPIIFHASPQRPYDGIS